MKNSFKINLSAFIFLLLFNSCSNCGEYIIKREYIETNCKFEDGFYFEHILVDSLDVNGIPVVYRSNRLLHLNLKTTHSTKVKRIYFYQENPNYKWHDITGQRIVDTLPIQWTPGNWYMIRGKLNSFSGDFKKFFLEISGDGTLKVFEPRIITNW